MNKNAKKLTALALSAAILVGAGATGVYAQKNDQEEEKKPLLIASNPTAGTAAQAKDETVYVISGADGKTQKVIVSSWLENREKADSVTDLCDLQNIENVKGDETFTAGADGKIIWNAAGEDIYYQGTSQKQLPVEMTITYTLDGKKMEPEAMAGKSGRVTIRFDFENTCYEEVEVEGKPEKIYVPFTMLTGTMLDTEVFRNVTVKNGRTENFGNQIAVLGVAMPGMQENLNITREKLEIPSYVEITADAENFSMGPTMTVATTALFHNLDTAKLNAGDLAQQADQLKDGVIQLLDGSNQLYDGLNQLLEQTGVLTEGVQKLGMGAAQLQSGASQLQGGASQLVEGLGALDANSAALVGGSQQVFHTLLAAANTQLKAAGLAIPELTIENYSEVLTGVISSIDHKVYETAQQQVSAGVNAHRDEIVAAVTEAVRQGVAAKVEPLVIAGAKEKAEAAVKAQEDLVLTVVLTQAAQQNPQLPTDAAAYGQAVAAGIIPQAAQDQISAAVKTAMEAKVQEVMESSKDQIAAMTKQKTQEQMNTAEVQALIAQNVEATVQQKIAETMASKEIQDKIQAAAGAAKPVIDLKTSLDSYNSFYLGLKTYTGGVAAAAAGARELQKGTGALKNGADALSGGIHAMEEKTPALVDGVTQLRDGSGALRDGIRKLMDEGISKITELTEGDLETVSSRLQASVEAARNYSSFSGLEEQTVGSVKFIYKTDSVEADQ